MTKRYIFCIKRRHFLNHVPAFEKCVEKREVVNETPKGYRVVVSYGTTVYLQADYVFFEGEAEAYAYCAQLATAHIEKVKAELQKHEEVLTKLLDKAGDRVA